MTDCPLCKVIEGGAPLLFFRDEHAIAMLHDDWAVRGHAMIVSSLHVENASDLEEREHESFMRTVRHVEGALLRVFDGDRAIWMKLGLAVPHFHLHVYPFGREATRGDVFAAIEMKVRDEPDEDEKRRLLERLRAEAQR